MRELIDKYYVFTLTFVVLSLALFLFRDNNDIVNMIIGAFIGAMSVPVAEKIKSTINPS